jgi:hypothetical protein
MEDIFNKIIKREKKNPRIVCEMVFNCQKPISLSRENYREAV